MEDENLELKQYALSKKCTGYADLENFMNEEEIKAYINDAYDCLFGAGYFNEENTTFNLRKDYIEVFVDEKLEGKYTMFFDRSVNGWRLYTYPEEDEKFEDYNPDDVPEDDTEDYEDHILHSHEEFDLDDTENESLKEDIQPFNEDVKDWHSQTEVDRFAKYCHLFGLEPEDQFRVFISERGNEEQILGIIKPNSPEPSLIIKNLETKVDWAWNTRIFEKLFYKWKDNRYSEYGDKEADEEEEERRENEPQFEPVNPPMNLYDYLEEYSNGAWISFTFDLGDGHDWQENYCHGVSDFRDPELLKQYEVTEDRCDYTSLDQGSSYTLRVRKIKDIKEGVALFPPKLSDEEYAQWREFEHYTDVIDYTLRKTLTSEFGVKVAGGIWERPNKEEEKYISGFIIVKEFSPSHEYQEIPPEVLKRALEICKENNVEGEAVKGISTIFPHVNFVIHYDFGQ